MHPVLRLRCHSLVSVIAVSLSLTPLALSRHSSLHGCCPRTPHRLLLGTRTVEAQLTCRGFTRFDEPTPFLPPLSLPFNVPCRVAEIRCLSTPCTRSAHRACGVLTSMFFWLPDYFYSPLLTLSSRTPSLWSAALYVAEVPYLTLAYGTAGCIRLWPWPLLPLTPQSSLPSAHAFPGIAPPVFQR